MSNRDQDRLDFIALKIKAGVPLSSDEQAQWDRHHHLGDKIKAGLPLTEAEREKIERAKDARVSIRGGTLWVEAPSMTVEDWKAHVSKSRAAPAKLAADAGTDKSQT